MMVLVLGLLMGASQEEVVIEYRADVLEINHYYDDNGKLVFTQLIWWDWDGDDHRVRDWRYLIDGVKVGRKHDNNNTACIRGRDAIWIERGMLIRVRSRSHITTWTQYDREVKDREHLPQCNRKGVLRAGNFNEN